AQAKRYLAGRRESESVISRLSDLLEEYQSKFVAAFQLSQEFDKKRADMHKITESNESVLSEFVKLAADRAIAADLESTGIQRSSDLTLVAVFLLVLAVAIGVAHVISNQITHAVNQLATGARTVGSGDLRTRIEVAGRDELAELGGSFNTMVSSLR